MALTPDGSRLYFSSEAKLTLDVVDTSTMEIIKEIPLSGRPNNIFIGKDGRYVYVGIMGGEGGLDVIDTTTLENVKHIVLDFTDHLSDYQLYTLIYRDILPTYEKKLDRRNSYLHWDCANMEGDPDMWLRYYASHEERRLWAEETGGDLPPRETPARVRRSPGHLHPPIPRSLTP